MRPVRRLKRLPGVNIFVSQSHFIVCAFSRADVRTLHSLANKFETEESERTLREGRSANMQNVWSVPDRRKKTKRLTFLVVLSKDSWVVHAPHIP